MTTGFPRCFPSLLVAALLAVPASAATDYFLELEGIPGESKDRAHPALIEVESFSIGATNSASAGTLGGTGGSRGVSFSDISFNKVIDKTSPLLFLRTANGMRIPKATLFVRKTITIPTTQLLEYYTIILTDAVVTSVQTRGAGGDPLRESFSLSFGKIEFSYKPQKPDGSLDAPIKSGWDVVNNRAL